MAPRFLAWLTPQPFEAELERVYQGDLRNQVFKQVKLSILIGTGVFFSFIILDLTDIKFAHHLWIRIPAVLFGLALWLYIHRRPEQAKPLIFHFALIGAVSASTGHLSMLLSDTDGTLYFASYPSSLFIIAFIYGPLFAPLIPATLLCLALIVTSLLIAVSHAVPAEIVFGAGVQLCLIVIVSYFSRYQLELFSRRSFIDKRTADLARTDADEKRQQAEEANREKAAFLRNASHNLRQPTQALSSYTMLLEKALQGRDLPSASNAARNVTYAVDLLAESFDKILDISRIDRDDYSPGISHISVNELLVVTEKQYMHHAKQKGIRLKIVLREKPPHAIRSDKVMLQQIISNLVDNAIKYTKKGWVVVKVTKSTHGLRLHIIDSGIGISTEHKQSIFQPFYRINEHGDEAGMGIGLSYVDKAIRKLPEHRLGYHSQPDRGTHFYIDLPAHEQHDVPCYLHESITSELKPGVYVLLVDDNALVRDALEKLLMVLGCVVETAASATETQQILKDNFRAFDLIITDYKLAGAETAESIIRCVHEFTENIPVIVLTGERYSGETISLLGKEFPLLRKPANSVQLSRSITRALVSSGHVLEPHAHPSVH